MVCICIPVYSCSGKNSFDKILVNNPSEWMGVLQRQGCNLDELIN
jgi:hypothetical protein